LAIEKIIGRLGRRSRNIPILFVLTKMAHSVLTQSQHSEAEALQSWFMANYILLYRTCKDGTR
jgi:hypothetical protein